MLDEMMNISIKQTTKINLIVKSVLMFRPSVSCQSSRLEQHFSTALPFQVHLKHTHTPNQIKTNSISGTRSTDSTSSPGSSEMKWSDNERGLPAASEHHSADTRFLHHTRNTLLNKSPHIGENHGER